MFYHRFETVFDINIYLYSGWSFTTEGWCCVREREREREREILTQYTIMLNEE